MDELTRWIVDEDIEKIATTIRKYVRSQVDIWRTLPYWTLEAEGRSGWLDKASLTYRNGLYPVNGKWPPQVLVDCFTGELVHDNLQPASAKKIVMAYLNNMDVDAELVRNHLKARAASDTRDLEDTGRQRDLAERERIRRSCNVEILRSKPALQIKWGFNFP